MLRCKAAVGVSTIKKHKSETNGKAAASPIGFLRLMCWDDKALKGTVDPASLFQRLDEKSAH